MSGCSIGDTPTNRDISGNEQPNMLIVMPATRRRCAQAAGDYVAASRLNQRLPAQG